MLLISVPVMFLDSALVTLLDRDMSPPVVRWPEPPHSAHLCTYPPPNSQMMLSAERAADCSDGCPIANPDDGSTEGTKALAGPLKPFSCFYFPLFSRSSSSLNAHSDIMIELMPSAFLLLCRRVNRIPSLHAAKILIFEHLLRYLL